MLRRNELFLASRSLKFVSISFDKSMQQYSLYFNSAAQADVFHQLDCAEHYNDLYRGELISDVTASS